MHLAIQFASNDKTIWEETFQTSKDYETHSILPQAKRDEEVVAMLLSDVSSGSESVSALARQAENSTSGWGSFWERSPLGSWFSSSAFWKSAWTVPGNVLFCGFTRNSSNLDSAPNLRDCVLLISWNIFILTLPWTSSDTCARKSSVIPGAAEFCDWLILGYSCVSLAVAARFHFFSQCCRLREKIQRCWRKS